MKKLAVFVTLAFLICGSCPVLAQSTGRGQNLRGIPQGKGKIYDSHGRVQQTWKHDSSGDRKVYDQYGRLQETWKRDSNDNIKVQNQHGQTEQVWKRDSSGNMRVYDQHGRLQETCNYSIGLQQIFKPAFFK